MERTKPNNRNAKSKYMPPKGLACLLTQVAAAIVFAAVATGAIIYIADVFYGKPEGNGRGYKVDIANTPAAVAMASVAVGGHSHEVPKQVDITPYLQKVDLALGEKIIKQCQACHNFVKGGPNGVGPNQYNLVGRKVAVVPGFEYSDGMKAKGGTWTFQALSDFLTSPKAVVPGTKMGFAGLAAPEQRAAVIAYINKTYSDKPFEIPNK